MSPTFCAFALVVSFLPGVQPAAPQSASADPDLKELSAYTLTMDTVDKIDRAMQAVASELKKDPRFAEQARLAGELEAPRRSTKWRSRPARFPASTRHCSARR